MAYDNNQGGNQTNRGGLQGGLGGMFGFGGGNNGAAPVRTEKLETAPADFDAFERKLTEVQTAYGAEDIGALRRLATPEMMSYFDEELTANARKGLVNRLSEPKLLQGDLSEAWREGADEYATVAMRFSLIDTMVDKASGRVVSGDQTKASEATEVWTFVRPRGATPNDWQLSAIQQA
jgi:predicted lipid-binding transport protein (Tim44 family)